MTTTEVVTDSAALIGRQMKHLKRVPEKLVGVTLMPLMLVVVFGYLFGSSMSVPGGQLRRVAMISDALPKYTKWNGKDTLPPEDKERILVLLRKAHDTGKPFRFWAAPDGPGAWKVLEDLGVSWINTDHPGRLQEFCSGKAK